MPSRLVRSSNALSLGALASSCLAGTALAHAGDAETGGFGAGVLHPLAGADHLLAMFAVGVIAAMLGGRALWLVPLGFLGAMLAGGALALAGIAPPSLELAIVLSVVLLGLAIATGTGGRIWPSVAAASFFGLFHGSAHGLELPAGADALRYAAGFVAATAGLHLAGMLACVIGRTLPLGGQDRAVRAGGFAIALAGVGLMIG